MAAEHEFDDLPVFVSLSGELLELHLERQGQRVVSS